MENLKKCLYRYIFVGEVRRIIPDKQASEMKVFEFASKDKETGFAEVHTSEQSTDPQKRSMYLA